MSSIKTIMTRLKELGIAFQHDFGLGAVTVFKTVKVYDKESFNRAAQDLLIIEKPALVILYKGSSYQRESKAASFNAKRMASDRRTAQFIFFIADQTYGFETQEASAIGDSETRGAIVALDAWRDRLVLVDPKNDWNLSLSLFEPVNDGIIPLDPEAGDSSVYSLLMQTRFTETASA